MSATVVLGAQWGDEGKGKLVDILAYDSQLCCRAQGGNNAGHTIVANGVTYDFHILPSGLIAWALSRRFGVPYVITAHGSDVPGYNPDRFRLLHRLLRPVWLRILRGAALATSPSRFLARLMYHEGCRVPIAIVANGHWPQQRFGETRRNRILVVARMFPRKGVQYFIDAVSGMGSDWELIIAGDGP